MKLFILLPVFFLVSCGGIFDFQRWPNHKLPRKILVPRDKYNEFKQEFDEVEQDYQDAVNGKDLVDFVPTDKDLKYEDSKDLFNKNRFGDSYLMFRESEDEFKDLDGSTVGKTWHNYNPISKQIKQAHIVIDFADYYLSANSFKHVLLHEVGHLLGFEHAGTRDSVMYAYTTAHYNLTGYDVDLVYDHYIFEQIANMYKDLEKMGARIERKDLDQRSLDLSLNYGLSQERSYEVARVLTHMDRISEKRSLTSRKKDMVSRQLLGIDYTTSKKALENLLQGDKEGMDELLEQGSKVNGITPEHVSDLITEFISLN